MCSEGQDEDNGRVPARRKCRPRSELILAYQCSVCDKKYASSQALYQHRRSSHNKQPPVTGAGHSDALEVHNRCVEMKEARVHPSAHVGKDQKLVEHFLVRCVA